VTAQLIEAETGGHLWAERWDQTMADLFDVQYELTSAIVTGVEPELGGHERILSRKKPTEHLTAWELAQRGNLRSYEFTSKSCDIALDLYNQAMKIDPEFAFVHALAARTHFFRLALGWSEDFDQDLRERMRLVDQAVYLDPNAEPRWFERTAVNHHLLPSPAPLRYSFCIAVIHAPRSIFRMKRRWADISTFADPRCPSKRSR
jgi:adenylate cyclase